MRNMKPGAMPVVELQSVQMPTKFGKKPRPFFKIVGWRNRASAEEQPPQLSDQGRDYEAEMAEMNAVDDEVVF
jgi:hypothetical protein